VALGITARHRISIDDGEKYLLREPELVYRSDFDAEIGALRKYWCSSSG